MSWQSTMGDDMLLLVAYNLCADESLSGQSKVLNAMLICKDMERALRLVIDKTCYHQKCFDSVILRIQSKRVVRIVIRQSMHRRIDLPWTPTEKIVDAGNEVGTE